MTNSTIIHIQRKNCFIVGKVSRKLIIMDSFLVLAEFLLRRCLNRSLDNFSLSMESSFLNPKWNYPDGCSFLPLQHPRTTDLKCLPVLFPLSKTTWGGSLCLYPSTSRKANYVVLTFELDIITNDQAKGWGKWLDLSHTASQGKDHDGRIHIWDLYPFLSLWPGPKVFWNS